MDGGRGARRGQTAAVHSPGCGEEERGQWVKAFIKAVDDGHPGALQIRGNIVSTLTVALLSVVNLLKP